MAEEEQNSLFPLTQPILPKKKSAEVEFLSHDLAKFIPQYSEELFKTAIFRLPKGTLDQMFSVFHQDILKSISNVDELKTLPSDAGRTLLFGLKNANANIQTITSVLESRI